MVRGLFPLLLVAALIIETRCKNETEALIRIAYNKLITRRIIAKREVYCNWNEYDLGVQCCKKCERGFVKNIACPTDISKHCVPCENGKEYIDHANDLAKCLRCSSCDSIFGLEVAKNCTPTQNTKCTCAKNHFCNSSVPCRHCDPCTICESGVIEKQCTSTSDTVCGMKETGVLWWAILLVILLLLLTAGGIYFAYRRKQNSINSKKSLNDDMPKPDISDEIVPLKQDVDLSNHIADIVEELTLDQTLKFVRYQKVSETKIDEICHDNNNTCEQKIQLFRAWLQKHGMEQVYETLIRSLRKLEMRAVADKIERKLQAAVSNSE
ncbi:tumor necrosis factor receptor superfamily member 6 [Strigops habroptila]|uniref:Tumor necrosis factor receptor superfamily member 6 n=1 Tax=Strigops habroptila TaxID=2489341 RepID=A0A672TTU0_STRHB|nr:tumor necrosis factor receptor superfamily member 6 [Strigops habroptila]